MAAVGDDVEAAGRLVQKSYLEFPGYPADDAYDALLADVRGRLGEAVVLLAVDGDGSVGGRVLGCLTFVPGPGNPHYEFDDPDAASFRYFAVDRSAQGRGVGEAMVRWCIGESSRLGRQRLLIHTLDSMTAAQRLYLRLGFQRDRSLDHVFDDGVEGLAFRLDL